MMKLTILTLAAAAGFLRAQQAPQAPPPRPYQRLLNLGDEKIMHRGFPPDFGKEFVF